MTPRCGFSSSASPEPNEKEHANTNTTADPAKTSEEASVNDQAKNSGAANGTKESGSIPESQSESVKRRRRVTKRTAFSDSDSEDECDLSRDDLVKLVAEKEDLLKLKHKEIEKMHDKVLRTYAEMENVMDRTRREAENSKKFAIQVCVYILSCFHAIEPLIPKYVPFNFVMAGIKCAVEFCKEFTRCCGQFGKSFLPCKGKFFKN